MKSSKNLLKIEGSGITFYPGQADGLVRCKSCFSMHCEKDQKIASKDSFSLGHLNPAASGGNTLALGLIIDSGKKEKLVEGHIILGTNSKRHLLVMSVVGLKNMVAIITIMVSLLRNIEKQGKDS